MKRRLWVDEIRQNLTYAVRQLTRAPAFAAITVLTLGLAIGANTAVFSVVNAVLLAPLPFPEADRVAVVWTRYLPPSGFDIPKFAISGPEALDLAETSEVLSSVGVYTTGSRTLTGESTDAERIEVGFVSAGVLPTLGVQPVTGRWIDPAEDVPDGPQVAVIGHDLWTARYGADPTLIGSTILMNGLPTEVVGVMPADFDFPEGAQAWLPLGLGRENEGGRGSHGYGAVGRLGPGMEMTDLDAELEVVKERWAAEYEHNEAHFLWAQPIRTELVADAPARLTLLMAAVGLVLLVACANIANLLLARGEVRHAEVAVRTALGAGRGRITRQLATESLVLAGAAALAGLGLAWLGVRAIVAIDPQALPRLDEVGLDGTVLLFTLVVTVATALLFGIVPAYLTGRRSTASLASSAARAVGGRRSGSLRRLLVTGEVALSLVVVILAGLVVRSFSALTATDPRMNPENVLTFSISLPTNSYEDDALLPDAFERLLDEIRAVPGVTDATAGSRLPFGGLSQWDFELDDRPPRADGEAAWNTGVSQVSTDYFRTLGIPVLEGRTFTLQDDRSAPLVAVVSETLARRYWPGESVIGKRIGFDMDDGVPWMTIVGVVPDPVTGTLDGEPYQHLYAPLTQSGISTYVVPRSMGVAVRAGGDVDGVVAAVRTAVAGFDSDLPLHRLSTMESRIDDSLSGPRVTSNLLAVFALIALVLAAVGVYGVISYSVACRTREIGLRVALGAERAAITRMILAEGSRPVLGGVALGLGGAWFSTRLVESMLFGIARTDALTFSLIPACLLAVGVIASLVPALRATAVAPTEALRE